jgi:hypothetical protein
LADAFPTTFNTDALTVPETPRPPATTNAPVVTLDPTAVDVTLTLAALNTELFIEKLVSKVKALDPFPIKIDPEVKDVLPVPP